MSVDDANNVKLTVSDHLDWSAKQEHLFLLREKINTYCKYVENGQMYHEYPETGDRRPAIEIVFFRKPVAEAKTVSQKGEIEIGARKVLLLFGSLQGGGQQQVRGRRLIKQAQTHHSYRSASIGSRLAAR